jgi:hypothetical protein
MWVQRFGLLICIIPALPFLLAGQLLSSYISPLLYVFCPEIP